jgi:hypothetical protein
MMRRRFTVLALLVLAIGFAVPTGATPTPAPALTPTPGPSTQATASGSTLPASTSATLAPTAPTVAPARPVSTVNLKVFTGQLLDIRSGYAFFTTGDAFKIIPAVRVVDYFTGKPTTKTPGVKLFAKATLDPTNATIVELAITTRYLPPDTEYASVQGFAAKDSPFSLAPELNNGKRYTGKPVSVQFTVDVPSTTAITDNVYITTDESGWVPYAYRMDRINANQYRVTRVYASGTKFHWKVTRGSWATQQVALDGGDVPPREFTVSEGDVQNTSGKVERWADQSPSQQNAAGPNGIPTPFNPNPFSSLPPNPNGPAQPQSTLGPNGLPPGCPTATTGACAPAKKK